MSRPRFISGLLAEVGTAIDPITLVKRIPSGLEVEGLKDGLKKMIREYDLQDSISSGVAQVLSSEVAVAMATLRKGRREAIKFDVLGTRPSKKKPIVQEVEVSAVQDTPEIEIETKDAVKPGQCASCGRQFHPEETETLVGFACGHVYHVSHLLHGPDSEGDEALLPRSAAAVEDDDEDSFATENRFSRSVGPKVTNARLLRDKIRDVGGCTLCKAAREREAVVGGG
jgi:hypothetical protein